MDCTCYVLLPADLTPVIGAVLGALFLGAFALAGIFHLATPRRKQKSAAAASPLKRTVHGARQAMDATSDKFTEQVAQWLRR